MSEFYNDEENQLYPVIPIPDNIIASENHSRIESVAANSKLVHNGFGGIINATGASTVITTTGDQSKITSSGARSVITALGFETIIDASGELTAVATVGFGAVFRLGVSCIASIKYHNVISDDIEFAMAYAGRNVKVGKWYKVNFRGDFIEMDEPIPESARKFEFKSEKTN